ncbi:riboflavin kinase [Candidatus Kaiserbacteria bacterium]|nr:riboflavin kinase [Candidatus Kaiserbacteria bacterium]
MRRGMALGFPTINIPLDDTAVSGIFAARVIVDGEAHGAAAFADPSRKILEAHILDISPDLYGKEVSVELCKKIRESSTFEDEGALKAAIENDVKRARLFFDNA